MRDNQILENVVIARGKSGWIVHEDAPVYGSGSHAKAPVSHGCSSLDHALELARKLLDFSPAQPPSYAEVKRAVLNPKSSEFFAFGKDDCP